MSVTAATWAGLAATLLVLAFRRPVYGVALYLLTFFAAPHLWWWGNDLPEGRYAVYAGVVLLLAVALRPTPASEAHRFGLVHKAALAMALNATLVHVLLASNLAISENNYVELLKYVLLTFLMWRAIEDRRDLQVVLVTIALGAAYIGYEVTINERGDFSGSRLEGIGAPSADTANGLACLMLTVLPLIGSLLLSPRIRDKVTALAGAPLALNVLLLCNSRGAFLALIGAGASFFVAARGETRKKAMRALALGGVTLFLLLGDPDIFNRFTTTFVGSAERDNSAASRLLYWRAGLLMIADYPLGDGGGSFKYVRGGSYIARVGATDSDARSIHNGYLTEATEWGLQGLLLRLLFLGAALLAAYRAAEACRRAGRLDDSLVGVCLIVSAAAFLIASMFGSFLANEWGYWLVALLVRYSELYATADAPAAVARVPAARALSPNWPAPRQPAAGSF